MLPSKYNFLLDTEAVSFIRIMAGELLQIAKERDFQSVIPCLIKVKQAAQIMRKSERVSTDGASRLAGP